MGVGVRDRHGRIRRLVFKNNACVTCLDCCWRVRGCGGDGRAGLLLVSEEPWRSSLSTKSDSVSV